MLLIGTGPLVLRGPVACNLMLDIVVSQGRVADRTAGAIPGALLTAQAVGSRTGRPLRVVGEPSSPRNDDWTEALPAAADTLTSVRDTVARSLAAGHVPVMVASTCATSLATLPLVADTRPDAFVLWFDAHGDFNTPQTTGSGYLGGMVLAAGCGLWDSGHGAGLDRRNVVLVGARDIDDAEQDLLDAAGVRILRPLEATPDRLREIVGDRSVWIHIDWDVLEPGWVPAAYRVPEGLLPAQLEALLAVVPPGNVAGVEIAEFEAGGTRPDADSVATIIETVGPLLSSL